MRINDVIAAASEELGVSFENNYLWFKVLIYQAIRSHKTRKKYKQYHRTLEVYDDKIELPDGWFKLDYIYICGSTSKDNKKLCPDIDYYVQDNYIIFCETKTDGSKYEVWYQALNRDEHDEIVIPDDWERMLVSYIGWKYTRRYAKEYPAYVMQSFQREYQTQKLANV